jgi:NADPH:quinone reductase-like Zn-dependent oxidoreductase
MARVARIERTGGPEVIEWVDVDLPPPGHGEVLVRSTAVGLNYIDTYHRRGIYPIALPGGLGMEAAGVVDAVGDGVTGLAVEDRVASFGPIGSYATARNVATESLFKLPDGIDDRVAAAAMLKGCTTEFLVERCAKVQPGWDVLVHAAAGGVGLLLVQWLKHVGARVIGTVSTPDKADAARAAGADEIILYKQEEVAPRVRALTGGNDDRPDLCLGGCCARPCRSGGGADDREYRSSSVTGDPPVVRVRGARHGLACRGGGDRGLCLDGRNDADGRHAQESDGDDDGQGVGYVGDEIVVGHDGLR